MGLSLVQLASLVPFWFATKADHRAIGRPDSQLSATFYPDPVSFVQAAYRPWMVVDSYDSTTELLCNVRREVVPQKPFGIGQPDAPPPPVVRDPPSLARRTFPEGLWNFAGRDAHFDFGCLLLILCDRHVLDVDVPEVPPRRRGPAFEPVQLLGDS